MGNALVNELGVEEGKKESLPKAGRGETNEKLRRR